MSARGGLLLGWTVVVLSIALFVWAGFWQLDRMHEKQAMLDAAHAVLVQRHALPLAAAADPARHDDYDWASGTGHFAALPAVLLDNQAHDERAGVRAYRVFLPDAGAPLLVDLGWLPLPGDRRLPAVAMPADARRVTGLLSAPPSAGILRGSPERQPDGRLLLVALDLPSLRKAFGLPTLAPRVLRLDPAMRLGYVRDLEILPNSFPPQRHLGYAVQWFAMALGLLVAAIVVTLRKTRTAKAQR